MRPVLHGDLTAAARALLGEPVAQRRARADQMLSEAHAADKYFKRFRRSHPKWGNGALMSRALGEKPVPEPALGDAGYRACLQVMLRALDLWQARLSPPKRS